MTYGRWGNHCRQEEEALRASRRVPGPSVDSVAVVSDQSHKAVDMLRKMLLVSTQYFDGLRHADDLDAADTEKRNERRQIRSLLKKTKRKESHYCDI